MHAWYEEELVMGKNYVWAMILGISMEYAR